MISPRIMLLYVILFAVVLAGCDCHAQHPASVVQDGIGAASSSSGKTVIYPYSGPSSYCGDGFYIAFLEPKGLWNSDVIHLNAGQRQVSFYIVLLNGYKQPHFLATTPGDGEGIVRWETLVYDSAIRDNVVTGGSGRPSQHRMKYIYLNPADLRRSVLPVWDGYGIRVDVPIDEKRNDPTQIVVTIQVHAIALREGIGRDMTYARTFRTQRLGK